MPLRARTIDNYRYCNSWKRAIESHQKSSKELIQKRMQRGLRVITLQGAIKKRKFEWLDVTIIISYFQVYILPCQYNYMVCINLFKIYTALTWETFRIMIDMNKPQPAQPKKYFSFCLFLKQYNKLWYMYIWW